MKHVITGGSGYIGSRLVKALVEKGDEVVIADIRPPRRSLDGVRFVQIDVRDRAMNALLEAERPDTLVHLAFVLNPIHDEHEMYDIDVNGTANVLDAADRIGVEHLLVASSATAYGAWPDNPVPMGEDQPVRGVPDYEYARDKTEIDRMTQLWAATHPETTVTIVRPAIVFGPTVDNYIIRAWQNLPFVVLPDGVDSEWQLVHKDDLTDGLLRLLADRRAGAFNVTGDGTIRFSEMAALAGKPTRNMSSRIYKRLTQAAWKLRLPRAEAPGGMVAFMRYPWIMSNEKLKAQTGWSPRYTTRETFEIALRAKGMLVGPGATAVEQRQGEAVALR
jgi:UDP-glucose 4-epimerase